jgi:hypothetical protein
MKFISLSRLKRLICTLPHVCSSVYEARRFSTAFALACFDLLRVDEFTSDSKSISGTHVLCFNDISFHKINNKEELYVKVCSSKTDQRQFFLLKLSNNLQTRNDFAWSSMPFILCVWLRPAMYVVIVEGERPEYERNAMNCIKSFTGTGQTLWIL